MLNVVVASKRGERVSHVAMKAALGGKIVTNELAKASLCVV
jgi:hypothetical protein